MSGEVVGFGVRRKGTAAIVGIVPEKIAATPPKSDSYLRDFEEVQLVLATDYAALQAKLESSRETNAALVRGRCQMDDEIAALQAKLDAVTKDAGGWLRAVDEALVIAHLDVANASDDYATARRKLGQLIDWHVAVATDPAVNGGDRLIPEALLREILDDCKGVGVEPCIGSMAPFEDLCGRIELILTDQGRAGEGAGG